MKTLLVALAFLVGIAVVGSITADTHVLAHRASLTVFETPGLAGCAGAAGRPNLAFAGTPAPGNLVDVILANAAPSAPARLIVGASTLFAPFKGCVIGPTLDALFPPVSTNAAGDLTLTGSWPASVPPGVTIFMQQWIVDPTGPAGFTASNTISVVSQ